MPVTKSYEGKVDFAKAFSTEKGTSYSPDVVMEVASMTKLPTSIAALQIVEKGLVTLDEDVSHLIPSFAKQGILTSVADDGTPTVRERQNPITLRRLITHSSGAGYSFLDEKLGKIRAPQYELPLLFEPGEGWVYGTGIDRVGHVVEKLTGLSLDEYMKVNIWGPLGAESSTFFPDGNPAIAVRRVPMSFREDPNGPAVEKPGAPTVTTGLKHCFGGHGLLGSMADYFKMVYSLLIDDEKLLKKETAALMFQPQLTPASKQELQRFMETSDMKLRFPFSPEADRDYGLGGLLVVGDEHEYLRKGALMWGGASSLSWVRDPISYTWHRLLMST